jgi:glycosyltransferase involved in cell wall biosynthesis
MGPRPLILQAAAREWLTYDMGSLRGPIARATYAACKLMLVSPSTSLRVRAFQVLMRLHSGAFSPEVDRWIVDEIRRASTLEQNGHATGLGALYDNTVRTAVETFVKSPKPDPLHMLGSHVLVIKAAQPGERGVLIVDYSNHFPLFAGFFDLQAIANRYTIVLEPSWAGTCTPDILLYSRIAQDVHVQTTEPRDRDFLATLGRNLKVVPIAANWWVDPGSAPVPDSTRDIDVIMVAAWADIKRHWRVFKALGRLRTQGHRLKIMLIGYKYDRTKEEIASLAAHYGIGDQIEMLELIPPDAVPPLLARSKIHVLWSRRECANRAIIEAMIANVPVIVRDGLTFGFPYPYINERTGRFVRENELPAAILDMLATRDHYAPRQWILENMTCQKATAVLEQHLKQSAAAAGEPWSQGLAVKTSTLYGQRYLDSADNDRFRADYAFLAGMRRNRDPIRVG